jgi:hypothetical protein
MRDASYVYIWGGDQGCILFSNTTALSMDCHCEPKLGSPFRLGADGYVKRRAGVSPAAFGRQGRRPYKFVFVE